MNINLLLNKFKTIIIYLRSVFDKQPLLTLNYFYIYFKIEEPLGKRLPDLI